MYRPTREGDFLKELLKDFQGVLVSDFYAAYDSLECPQQKCLIHLMRDINQDLLNNPFDEELKSITGPFGTLLRAIVDDHRPARPEATAPEEAQARGGGVLPQPRRQHLPLRGRRGPPQRLLKNEDKLFTFIHHDGVPWNNNNAENAIKRFAYYREDTVGHHEGGGIDRLPGAAEHLPDLPVQGSQLPEVPAVPGTGRRRRSARGSRGSGRPSSKSTRRVAFHRTSRYWQTAKHASKSGVAQEQSGTGTNTGQAQSVSTRPREM